MRGRPMVINPLLRLLRKLTPVRTAMMTTIRPCFNIPCSKSIDAWREVSDTDRVMVVPRDVV